MESTVSPEVRHREYLRALEIGYYVAAGLCGLFVLLPLVQLLFALAMGAAAPATADPVEIWTIRFLGGFFASCAALALAASFAAAIGFLLAGRAIARRERHTFCLVMGGVALLLMPLGTLLGIFTFVLLLNPPIQAQFGVATTPS